MTKAAVVLALCAVVSLLSLPATPSSGAQAAMRPSIAIVDAARTTYDRLERKVNALAQALDTLQQGTDARFSRLERDVAAVQAIQATHRGPPHPLLRRAGFTADVAALAYNPPGYPPEFPGAAIAPDVLRKLLAYDDRLNSGEHRLKATEERVNVLERRVVAVAARDKAPKRGDKAPLAASAEPAGQPMPGFWLRSATDGVAFVSRDGAPFTDPPIALHAGARHPDFGRIERVYEHDGAWVVKTERGWLKSQG